MPRLISPPAPQAVDRTDAPYGPADGRLAPVEFDETGALPQTVLLLQSGIYIGTADHPSQPIEHRYVRHDAEKTPSAYR